MSNPTPNSPSVERISDPNLPFVTQIPGGVFPGKAITIRGSTLDKEPHRFAIDLSCGFLVEGGHRDDIAFHFNPRFIKKRGFFGGWSDEDIVLNSLINNEWGPEERCTNELKPSCNFTIRILILQNYFKIAVNGKHLSDYVHRIPYSNITALHINGAARIDVIEFEGTYGDSNPTLNATPAAIGQGAAPAAPSVNSHLPSADIIIRKPDVPFVHSFRPGSLIADKDIILTATPKMHATCFTLNLMRNGDYLFHLRVDFPHGKTDGALVRNHCINNRWAHEERGMSKFPFNQGITFDLKLSLGSDSVIAQLDGKHIFTFNYRPGISLNEVNIVSVTGDINIQRFELK